MNIICVDDEEIILNYIVSICEELPEIDKTNGFSDPIKALDWLKDNKIDIALLDIDMPKLNGIQLAVRIKDLYPDVKIIFLTGYSQYAIEAFEIHANGYLLKPVNKERLANEIAHMSENVKFPPSPIPHIFVRTFDNFDVYIDGVPIKFSRSKSKELFAYLVNKCGSYVSRVSAFTALYEDKPYDRTMQKQFDVIVRSLKETLKSNGISEIFEMKSGELRVRPENFDCDLYHLLKGDPRAVNAYRGVYMDNYPWAMMTEAYLERNLLN